MLILVTRETLITHDSLAHFTHHHTVRFSARTRLAFNESYRGEHILLVVKHIFNNMENVGHDKGVLSLSGRVVERYRHQIRSGWLHEWRKEVVAMRAHATHGKTRIKLRVASRAECRGRSKCKHGARWGGYGLLLWLSSWIATMLLLFDKGHAMCLGVVIDR